MDPFQGFPTRPLTLNKYLYGNGDPVNGIDPSGNYTLMQVSVGMAGLAIVAGTAQYGSQIGQSLLGGLDSDGSFTAIQTGWLVLAGMSGSGSALYRIIRQKVDERDGPTVDYYRAVDTGEMLDILDCDCFRFYDAGYGIEPTSVKRFWLNKSSAVKFGKIFIKGDFPGAREKSFFAIST